MDYDLCVIGSGWAGFNAALKARELGLKTCLIEKTLLGGTCLNIGCIPTKTLIQSAKIYSLIKKSDAFGVETDTGRLNFLRIQTRKEKIIMQLRQGMQFLAKGVDFINSEARIRSSETIEINGKILKTKNILIASGSRPFPLPSFEFDGKRIVSSDDILSLNEIPASLLIIGGGVIGCEFAALFAAFGTKVTILEKMPQLLPGLDKELAKKIEAVFKKKGISINTNTDASGFNHFDYDKTLVCVGRTPNTSGLGLEELGVKTEKGRIIVDEYLKTNIPNIYAAGDCASAIMLAHFARYQGISAAYNIAHPDKPKKAENDLVPNCIFTDPEIAYVGMNEEIAIRNGKETNIYRFDFLGNVMARIKEETEGFIKIVVDKNTGQLLGAFIIGPSATELIGTLTIAISSGLTITALKNTIFAHPTLSEAIGEVL
ncbi:MAG: dihydrolipoyl dehydrogenase [Candidatus Omnitrophica bacterium]|nr:dihydrolipoyl dehydrogenase [Candidatus Omnitrophota bacterium]